jgi:hypothetical protein
LGQVLILRCRDDEVFQALATSQQLRPYLKRIMDANILLVNAEDFEKVDAILRWAGILVSQHLEVIEL